MNIEIRYFSKFGHTKKMVEAIEGILPVKPEPITVPITDPVDILYLGCGVMVGKINWRMRNFIKTFSPEKVKKVICFGSSAIVRSPVPMLKELLEKQGIKVDKRSFTCLGSMGRVHSGHPDKKDIENFRYFISSTLTSE